MTPGDRECDGPDQGVHPVVTCRCSRGLTPWARSKAVLSANGLA